MAYRLTRFAATAVPGLSISEESGPMIADQQNESWSSLSRHHVFRITRQSKLGHIQSFKLHFGIDAYRANLIYYPEDSIGRTECPYHTECRSEELAKELPRVSMN